MDKGSRQLLIAGGIGIVLVAGVLIYINEQEKRRHELLLMSYQRQPLLPMPQTHIERPVIQLMPKLKPSAIEELKAAALWVKQYIENQKGFEPFYDANKKLISRKSENIMQHMYALLWRKSPFNYDKEVNNGGGPADGVASIGAYNKALIEIKIAANSSLEYILSQVEIYKKACRTDKRLLLFVCFKDTDVTRLEKVLKKLGLTNDPYVVTIDARYKEVSASKVRIKLFLDDFGRTRIAG